MTTAETPQNSISSAFRKPESPPARYQGTVGLIYRSTALLIDAILIGLLWFGLDLAITLLSESGNVSDELRLILITFIQWIGMILYFAVMESSTNRGTFGKMALGIQVTDTKGKQIGFARALGRVFAKFLSLFLFGVGFLMAAFGKENRALHDLLTSTMVQKLK